jgi:DNA-binding Xre family transcriptional regulator
MSELMARGGQSMARIRAIVDDGEGKEIRQERVYELCGELHRLDKIEAAVRYFSGSSRPIL